MKVITLSDINIDVLFLVSLVARFHINSMAYARKTAWIYSLSRGRTEAIRIRCRIKAAVTYFIIIYSP
jgi:hypothetical protein